MDRYIVIRRDKLAELESAVNSYIKQKGYEPIGGVQGVVVSEAPDEPLWCQAMFKRVIDIADKASHPTVIP